MAWQGRWLGIGLLALAPGCASDPEWALPRHSLADDISPPGAPNIVRLQVKEDPPLPLIPPGESSRQTGVIPPKPQEFPPPPKPILPPPGFGVGPTPTPPVNTGIEQVSLANRGKVRVRVRAWVNGRPIFEEEVMQAAGQDLQKLFRSQEMQHSEKVAEVINGVIDQLVDQELMYQHAVKLIEKNSPKGSLDKMRDFVDLEFDKSVKKMRDAKVPEEQIKEIEATARRMLERNLISTEYARSRVKPALEAINMRDIRDYYDTHLTEFKSVDKVVWQDIFIPVSPNLPTVEHVKRFAEELVNKCLRPDEDFVRLMVYNEGDSKLRGGEGIGQRRGEIRPQELEAVLFSLKEGEIGPVVPFASGVHLVRVTKREKAGQLPLDEKVQKTIRRNLENEIYNREIRRIVRELRTRAVVRVERPE